MSLDNTAFLFDSERKEKFQFFIQSYNGERSMLMEAESDSEALDWIKAFELHIDFANDSARLVSDPALARLSRRYSVESDIPGSAKSESNSPTTAATDTPSSRRASTGTISTPAATSAHSEAMQRPQSERIDSSGKAGVTIPDDAKPANPIPKHIHSDSGEISEIFHVIISELSSFLGQCVSFATDVSARNSAVHKSRQVCSSFLSNTKEGSKDGMKNGTLIFAMVLVFAMAILTIHPLFESMVLICLRFVVSPVFMLLGLYFILAAVWELNEQNSMLLVPKAAHQLVSTGVYKVVRHPMYTGLLMLCLGRAWIARSMLKLFFTIILGFILVCVLLIL
jgi:protein-S-isoprenylcysteine O-methyltransferase Ste14